MNVDNIVKNSKFISKWKDDMISSLMIMNKDWSIDDIEPIVDNMIKENIKVPVVTLDNNYTGESRQSNILSVLDWVLERKPLVAGNGTFYKNQIESINPIAEMIDGFLSDRKAIKKQMFKVEDTTSDEYKDLDRAQLNKKIMANSYYGASGMPKSAFYSLWSGPATTGTAQSVISTTETFFEGFLVDNYKFIDINECIHFMNTVINQDYELEDFIIPVSRKELFDRMSNMFYDDYNSEWDIMLQNYIKGISDEDVTKIFYKYNLMEFTKRHSNVVKLYDELFKKVSNIEYAETIDEVPKSFIDKAGNTNEHQIIKDYNNYVNKEHFLDPNSPPESIQVELAILNSYYMKYVYVPFMSIDRIHRLKYFPRKTVCIVDTDSNILALDLWVKFCNKELLKSDYGRKYESNKFIMINTLTYFITSAVSDTLNEYGIHSYIPDDYRKRFNMKNEFYFNKLVIGKKKKRYVSSIKLREGNLLEPYKADVKGFDYMKATTSDNAKKIFDSIVRRHILESEVPNVSAILYDLREFENQIRQSIQSGDKTYLPIGNAKELGAYKNPFSQQGVRGSFAWNAIYPDNEISFPSKVSILKLNVFSLDDIEDLRDKEPIIYNRIASDIFNSRLEEVRSKGLQVLAIPANSNIPEWVQPYIDYNTVINNIIGQFKGVLDVFGVNCPEVGKSIKSVNRKTKKFSNIVRF